MWAYIDATRELAYIKAMGKWLADGNAKKEGSLVQECYEHGVPIFCPAFSDCSAGFGLVKHQVERMKAGQPYLSIDSVADFRELTEIKIKAGTTGLFMVGGGVPKNFAQDTVVCAEILGHEDVEMHKYAVQITVADVRDGACSSSTLQEAAEEFDNSFRCAECNAEPTPEEDHDIVLCDGGCNRCFHIWCCTPVLCEVPEGEWLCSSCQGQPTEEDEPHEHVDHHHAQGEHDGADGHRSLGEARDEVDPAQGDGEREELDPRERRHRPLVAPPPDVADALDDRLGRVGLRHGGRRVVAGEDPVALVADVEHAGGKGAHAGDELDDIV